MLVFADEMPVQEMADILKEAIAIDALGTGITGGEPLLKLDYVLECIRALKRALGQAHHIHLYTGLLPGREVLERLKQAGLDEIRFHPPVSEWSHPVGLKEALLQAKALGLIAGVEIPSIKPAPAIVEAVRDADAFLNINELEFSETNYAGLAEAGLLAGGSGLRGNRQRRDCQGAFPAEMTKGALLPFPLQGCSAVERAPPAPGKSHGAAL